METLKLAISGMTCGHCARAIEGAVSRISGVTRVKVDLATASADIQYEPQTVTMDAIKSAIEEEGYCASATT